MQLQKELANYDTQGDLHCRMITLVTYVADSNNADRALAILHWHTSASS
jgi:hypothetical protein